MGAVVAIGATRTPSGPEHKERPQRPLAARRAFLGHSHPVMPEKCGTAILPEAFWARNRSGAPKERYTSNSGCSVSGRLTPGALRNFAPAAGRGISLALGSDTGHRTDVQRKHGSFRLAVHQHYAPRDGVEQVVCRNVRPRPAATLPELVALVV
jgi:hypothetical protein